MSNTKSHGYENMMLILVAVAIVLTLFFAIFHQVHISIVPNLETLKKYLTSSNN
jgi:hypothetical protein